MANLAISNVCNLSCPYCFAAMFMNRANEATTRPFITPEAFAQRLDFLERSHISQVRLIGGEPTLHPQFTTLVQLARQRGFTILVFTHGLMRARPLACLTALSPDECLVLVNMNATRSGQLPDAAETAQREAVVRQLGPRALLGFNIYRPQFDLEPLLTLIQNANARPAIRLGLAQPMLAGANAHLHPKQYPAVGRQIAQFARRAAAVGISLEFDCGFVRCMFTEEELTQLKEAGADVAWRCNPILDISLDGRAIHCFPLTGRVETAVATQDAATLRQQLTTQTQAYRLAGIYRECSFCPYKQQAACTGGCLAQTMRRFHQRALRFVVPPENGLCHKTPFGGNGEKDDR
ncbi:MAG TPA: radical SAM protein [Chloroflexota bacterium]|nr:radical SAM protein [Chloroflexota bacterium]